MDDEPTRTFSIWPILAVFAVLGLLGLVGFLLFDINQSVPTKALPVDASSTSTTAVSLPPATVFDGSPAPEGVESVIATPGATAWIWALPDSHTSGSSRTERAPVTATASADGLALDVVVGCRVGDDAAPSMVRIVEQPSEVRVEAAVTATAGAAPCGDTGAVLTEQLPLQEPLAGRPIVVFPPGGEIDVPGRS